MSTPAPDNSLSKAKTISVKHARVRVKNWKAKVKDVFHPGKSPRAIYIPMADINALAEKFGDQKDIKGVRAYLSIEYGDTGPIQSNPVRCLIVPVYLDKHDNKLKDLAYDYTDPATGAATSTIYDFTTPCPDLCDPSSPLFVS